MPAVRFSKEDFLAGKVVKPGPYHALIKGVSTQASKGDGSDVHKISVKIVEPGDYNGVPLQDYVSEKAQGTAIAYIKALNGGKDPEAGVSYDLANGINKIVKIQVGNSLYNGKIKNEILDYQPADSNFVPAEE